MERSRLSTKLVIVLFVTCVWSAATACAQAPYPPSTVITNLKWESDVLKMESCVSGDNWPMAWVDVDLQITAFCDGKGFAEDAPNLSLGFAMVSGNPPRFHAENFKSDADTPQGGGSKGIKASEMIMVDGALYMFVRNYKPPGSDDFTNSRLACSINLGVNWKWADWHFSDTFGCPAFVQFGKDYEGARDDYLYIASQANDNAYVYSPDIVMARVKKATFDVARAKFPNAKPVAGVSGTFSIVAVDPETGVCGAAVASKYPAVGKVVPYARAGVGAFCTQHWHNPKWGEHALDLLAVGRPPEQVLAELLKDDDQREKRQLAIIDMSGRVANHNPSNADPSGIWWGAASGKYYSCQGNTLVGQTVIFDMAKAYEETKGSLADRLMAALIAGDRAGGDHRGRLAAGIRIAKKGIEGYWLELYVDKSDNAVVELAKKYAALNHEAKGSGLTIDH